jgi:hypothetical protein
LTKLATHYGTQAVTEHQRQGINTFEFTTETRRYRSVEKALKTMTRRQGVEEVKRIRPAQGVAAWASTRHEVELW